MQPIVEFIDLPYSDLHVDTIYKGGSAKNAGADPLSKLMYCSNQGGFRSKKPPSNSNCNLEYVYVVLYSSLNDPDWPDHLDLQTGIFTYYGDNKNPGSELHNTKKGGNKILKNSYDMLHSYNYDQISPFFVFTKGQTGRDVVFRGLAVPGSKNHSSFEDLVAVWKIKDNQRFQNYRAIFTILDINIISRAWLKDLIKGKVLTDNTPKAYCEWLSNRHYVPLMAERTIEHRTESEQTPDENGKQIIDTIKKYFTDGYAFEPCAVEILRLMDRGFNDCTLTRPYYDGGKDAVGTYRIGLNDSCSVKVEFALEAKLYAPGNSVKVKEKDRLISRLRHRQFGVIVTTSFLHYKAYKEIVEDQHPVIVISGKDIVEIFKHRGMTSAEQVNNWLAANFSRSLIN